MPDAKAPASLAEALAALQAQLPHVTKDKKADITSGRTGKTFSYAYAEFSDISESLMTLMGPLGLSFSARPTMGDGFVLAYTLRHVSGESDTGVWPLPNPLNHGAQEVAAAIGWARRGSLLAVTGLAPAGEESAQETFLAAVREERADRAAARAGAGNTPAQQKQAATRKRTGQVDKDRMTNAERRDAGLMDRQQAAEHERAAALPPSPPADRSRGRLESDPWETRPPDEPENAPGTVGGAQIRAIWMLLDKQGIVSEATAHGMAYVALGLPEGAMKITDKKTGELRDSFTALSHVQAAEFIKQLQHGGGEG